TLPPARTLEANELSELERRRDASQPPLLRRPTSDPNVIELHQQFADGSRLLITYNTRENTGTRQFFRGAGADTAVVPATALPGPLELLTQDRSGTAQRPPAARFVRTEQGWQFTRRYPDGTTQTETTDYLTAGQMLTIQRFNGSGQPVGDSYRSQITPVLER